MGDYVFINLTPEEITIYDKNWRVRTVKPSGLVAKVNRKRKLIDTVDDVPLYREYYSSIYIYRGKELYYVIESFTGIIDFIYERLLQDSYISYGDIPVLIVSKEVLEAIKDIGAPCYTMKHPEFTPYVVATVSDKFAVRTTELGAGEKGEKIYEGLITLSC